MTRRDEIIAGIPPAEDLDLIAVDQTGPCPDLDAAIEKIDGNRGPQTCRVISEKCQECDRTLTSTETIHVTDGVVKCDPCWRGKVVDYATYPPANRSNWDE